MSPRLRFYSTALLIIALSTGVTLLLLTLLHSRLGRPAFQRFDFAVQAWVHAWSNPWLTHVMLALTWVGAIKIFATALALSMVYLALRGDDHSAVLLGGAITSAFALNEALKQHFHRARPLVPWSIGDQHTFSFPSGHSLFSVVLYGTLAYIALHDAASVRRHITILVLAILMPLGIGISRIYLGMHYPTDVAAGWLTGALWLGAVLMIDRAWGRWRSRALPSPSRRSF